MKGQAELLTIAIAIAITMLLVTIGIVWYAGHGIRKTKLDAEGVALKAASLPLWKCSYMGQSTMRCVDLLRLSDLGGEYFPEFGYSLIKLEYITADWQKESIVLYKNEKERFTEKEVKYVPVNVYDAKFGGYLVGNIKVEAYR